MGHQFVGCSKRIPFTTSCWWAKTTYASENHSAIQLCYKCPLPTLIFFEQMLRFLDVMRFKSTNREISVDCPPNPCRKSRSSTFQKTLHVEQLESYDSLSGCTLLSHWSLNDCHHWLCLRNSSHNLNINSIRPCLNSGMEWNLAFLCFWRGCFRKARSNRFE